MSKQALQNYIDSVRNKPFQWGVFDCCLFVAGAVKAATGVDHAKKYTHTSAREALNYLKEYSNLPEFIDSFGYQKCRVEQARYGDIVASREMRADGEHVVGICLGERSAFTGECGLIFRSTLESEIAWRVT